MGFEPTTPGLTIRCSNQLSYTHQSCLATTLRAPGRNRTCNRRLRRPVLYPVELRTPRPELSHRRFETAHLPSRTRIGVVGVEGFEPPTSCSQSRRATRLRYTPPTEPILPLRLQALRNAAAPRKAGHCPAARADCQRKPAYSRLPRRSGFAASTSRMQRHIGHAAPSLQCPHAKVAELVDALDLGSSAARRGGSSPPFRTRTIGKPHRQTPSARVMLRASGDRRVLQEPDT